MDSRGVNNARVAALRSCHGARARATLSCLVPCALFLMTVSPAAVGAWEPPFDAFKGTFNGLGDALSGPVDLSLSGGAVDGTRTLP